MQESKITKVKNNYTQPKVEINDFKYTDVISTSICEHDMCVEVH